MNPLATIKLIGAGLAVVGLITAGLVINHWRTTAARVPGLERHIEEVERSQKLAQEASNGYQQALEKLRTARRPAPVVRLCGPDVPAPAAAGGFASSAPAAGVLPPRAGPDIGAGLYGLADRCDELSEQLRALQSLAAGSSSR